MDVKDFDSLSLDDFANGAVQDEIRSALRELEKLRHYKDSTVGLWATDRPDMFENIDIQKHHMFELKFDG
jgi:hypothetical protein